MSKVLGDTLTWASKNYDFVIVDTPPVLAVTDAVIVGQLCGITLMVTRFAENTLKEISVASNRLRQNGLNVRGSIINAVQKRASSYTSMAATITTTTATTTHENRGTACSTRTSDFSQPTTT